MKNSEKLAVSKFANLVILEIERTYDQNFCAGDAINIIRKELSIYNGEMKGKIIGLEKLG